MKTKIIAGVEASWRPTINAVSRRVRMYIHALSSGISQESHRMHHQPVVYEHHLGHVDTLRATAEDNSAHIPKAGSQTDLECVCAIEQTLPGAVSPLT